MAGITGARAYANNEVALIAWALDGMIAGCLGFDIVRVIVAPSVDGPEPPKGLATWVPFEGQRNPTWTPQDTGVWPVQKLWWRDLTLRRHRADPSRRPAGFSVKYQIRPVGRLRDGLDPVPVRQPKAYDGPVMPLGYLGPVVETNEVKITSDHGDGISAAFTNGILSAQWLKHAIEAAGKRFNADTIRDEIANPASDIRKYLTGDVFDFVGSLIRRARNTGGKVRLALYELEDPALVQLLIDNKDLLEVILSNSSRSQDTEEWDATNHEARAELKREGVALHDRMFNNDHIGHNKFAVYFDNQGHPQTVMTGSTNWTSTGLCGQSNNAIIISEPKTARGYADYWQRLLDDPIQSPDSPTAGGHGKQGPAIRTADQTPVAVNQAHSKIQVWYAPNTQRVTKGTVTPPDLKVLFDLMAAAEQAIFFLAFLPSRAGADSIISTAIEVAQQKPKLFVTGTISDVTAMPNYVAPDKKAASAEARAGVKPYTFDAGRLHIVRATEIRDAGGDFERELLKVGNAIVHDKIVVVDPLSPRCVVATGSHNLGFKASYENDENLVIIQGNQALTKAYAVHTLDVFDHYRFRAWQAKAEAEGRPFFEGNIHIDDHWLQTLVNRAKDDVAHYFATGQV